jgi:hypothetical protein
LQYGISLGLAVWVTAPVTLVGVPVASIQETLNVHYNYLQDEWRRTSDFVNLLDDKAP